MWDGQSFVKHLLGNVHNQAMEKLIEEDVLRVARLRKVITNQIRNGDGTGDSKCGMCDVKVKDIMKHRRDEGHKNLKQFIHPHCEPCSADFEDRSECFVKVRQVQTDGMTGLRVRAGARNTSGLRPPGPW